MASLKSASRPKKSQPGEVAKPGALADYLLARAPAEDIAAYDAGDLQRAADLAWQAVARHKKGDCVVALHGPSTRLPWKAGSDSDESDI